MRAHSQISDADQVRVLKIAQQKCDKYPQEYVVKVHF
jgi:hypothetical protein